MAKFLVLHLTTDPKAYSSEAQMSAPKQMLDAFTADTYCIATWASLAAAKTACLWEAPSEQAIMDVFAKGPPILIDGIYPAAVIDWAEMKKQMAGG